MRNKKIIYLGIILLIGLSFNVTAFGVSSPYWDENPLYVSPGETKEVVMVLQNMPPAGTEDLIANIVLNGGNEIAKIINTDPNYNVPLGSNNVQVKIRIKIPTDAKPKQEWQVGISARTSPVGLGGVGLGSGINKGFKVIVKEEIKETGSVPFKSQVFLITLVILVLLFIVIKYFYKYKKN